MGKRVHEQYSVPVRGYDLDEESLPELLRMVATWLESGPAHMDRVKDVVITDDGTAWFATVYYAERTDATH